MLEAVYVLNGKKHQRIILNVDRQCGHTLHIFNKSSSTWKYFDFGHNGISQYDDEIDTG